MEETGTRQAEVDYGPKLDDALTQVIQSWWNGLSKQELLQYLWDRPEATADAIRKMLAASDAQIMFGVHFGAANLTAQATFGDRQQ